MISTTGDQLLAGKMSTRYRCSGFTLLELMVAFSIAALLVGVSAPATMKMYDSMQYRDTVRGVISAAQSARLSALSQGKVVDLVVVPDVKSISIRGAKDASRAQGQPKQLLAFPSSLQMETSTAAEYKMDGKEIIRFYPDGSSSGGSVSVIRSEGVGVRVRVDWLTGLASQEELETL